MRLFGHRIRRGHVRTVLIAVLLLMNGTAVSLCQGADSKESTRKQPDETLAVGTEVVFTCSSSSLTNKDRLARIAFPPPYVIDRLDGDRVVISSGHTKKQQSVARAQIVPFKKMIDDLSSQLANVPRSASSLALPRSSGRTTATTIVREPTWTRPYASRRTSTGCTSGAVPSFCSKNSLIRPSPTATRRSS